MQDFINHKLKKWLAIFVIAITLGMVGLSIISSTVSSVMAIFMITQQNNCGDSSDGGSLDIGYTGKNGDKKCRAIAQAIGKSLGIDPACVYAQVALESADGTSSLAKNENNFGGIKYSPAFSKYATPGSGSPEGDNYAHFKSIGAYAAVYRNTIKNDLRGKKPQGWREYVHAMKMAGYFGASEEEYYQNGLGYYKSYKGIKGTVADLDAITGDDASSCPDGSDALSVSGKWSWPFKGVTWDPAKRAADGQQFGNTSYARGGGHFHDGFDFGSSQYHGNVYAVHDGKVKYVGYKYGFWIVWVVSGDGFNEIYQEAFGSRSDISVSAGDNIKVGQKIGRLTQSHLHLGISKKHLSDPCEHAYTNDGTWIDPIKVIKAGLHK